MYLFLQCCYLARKEHNGLIHRTQSINDYQKDLQAFHFLLGRAAGNSPIKAQLKFI